MCRQAPTTSSTGSPATVRVPRRSPSTAALDFLCEQGFVHRIESRNAYVACCHVHEAGEVVFLLCDKCGAAGEVTSAKLAGPDRRDRERGTASSRARSVLEIRGLCARCRSEAGGEG